MRARINAYCRERHKRLTDEQRAKIRRDNYAQSRKPHEIETRKLYRRAARYGMSAEAQNAMLLAQDYRCAACRDPLEPGRRTHLDHDHTTGQVRGFLCINCNLAVGNLKDSPLRARKLAVYLESHAPKLALVAKDLSTMSWGAFCRAYRGIIEAACALLKPDAFACFVVGDIRDKAGLYRGFPNVTTSAFMGAGLGLYNEAILVTSVGSLPIRSGKTFDAGRKLGKTHQNVLVYVKGDPKRAAQACVNAGAATG